MGGWLAEVGLINRGFLNIVCSTKSKLGSVIKILIFLKTGLDEHSQRRTI